MPRPKKPGSAEPKKRSRNGCWPCKNRKIKCGEERPKCQNCERQGETCDYSIRLNWEGRSKRKSSNENQISTNLSSPSLHRESSISTVSDGGSTIRGQSPNPMATFMDAQYGRPSSAGIYSSQSSPFRDSISAAQLSRIRDQGTGPYPSPDSSMESPPLMNVPHMPYGGHHHSLSNPEMPPPFQSPQFQFSNSNTIRGTPSPAFADHRAKKIRLSPSMDKQDFYTKPQSYGSSQFNASGNLSMGPLISPPAVRYQSSSPSNGTMRIPPTPAASSVGSEDIQQCLSGPSPQPIPSPQPPPQESPDFRRLSVKSLLSDDSPADSGSSSEGVFPGKLNTTHFPTQKTVYGVDRGFADLDIPKNNDAIALNGMTPNFIETDEDMTDHFFSGYGFGLNSSDGFQEGAGYYGKPVTVSIPKSLEPLPQMLRDNPMNLLYFHHFLNHTARVLVPHDCSENPFKSLLPQMAVRDTNLLHLLLAYSASHRSRVLNHPEPANRIADWVQDVFPALREALDNPGKQISNSSLATAIMLASLQILNPNTFGYSVPWTQHLHVARQMILSRGGATAAPRKDKVFYFLMRWFAYLDVLGSLSGGKYDQPLFGGNYWALDATVGEQDYQIDCLLGFTSRLVTILAEIATLARTCDSERIDSSGYVRTDWQPSLDIMQRAEKLKAGLVEARMHHYQGCPHRRASTQIEDNSYAIELVTTNEAFHHAGLIHVNRRILGRPSDDPEVQFAIQEIVVALQRVRKGGTAEGCLLFPMFTAGCDTKNPNFRDTIMERLERMEGLGMSQVKKAKALMEQVWETGRPWESLVSGDSFIG